MELFLYYLAMITFILLAIYGLFLAGGSILQFVSLFTTHPEKSRYRPFVLIQFLHGMFSLAIGLLLNYFLEQALFSSLGLLAFAWIYMSLERLGRRWYTARFF